MAVAAPRQSALSITKARARAETKTTLMALQDNSGSWRRLAFAGGLVSVNRLALALITVLPLVAGAAGKITPAENQQQVAAEAGERIDALRAEIAHHDELYFKKSAPVVSDYEYDQLKRELAEREHTYPQLARGDTGIGDDRSGQFPVYRHRMRMLSLNKSYSEAELRAFDARLRRQLGRTELEYVVEPKFDGLAISVTYEKGRLVRAVTRGDGAAGDEVTANALTISSLPRTLRAKTADGAVNPIPEVIELRGEIYIGFAEFARINRNRVGAGEAPFAQPRNLAAGTLKQRAATASALRRLEIVFYGGGACEPAADYPDSQQNLLRQLQAWGLPTVESPKVVKGPDALWQAVQAIGRERKGYSFPIDGAVVKLNARVWQEQIGATTQAPGWAMAYKFSPDRAVTQLRAITLQVGRTGVLTPVAELGPVQLGGSTVTRASLYNRREIARRDIRVGDFVYVEKAGEIIPVITGVELSRRPAGVKAYEFPVRCPSCGTGVVAKPDESAVRCLNDECPAQVRRRIEHFASAVAVNIAGLGPGQIDRLVAKGWVKTVADLYRLRREDLVTRGTNVEKSTDRLFAAIERSKSAELWRFIHGLGIPGVGEVAAHDLARRFGGLEALVRAQQPDFLSEDGLAAPRLSEATGLAVLTYFAQPENRAVVQALHHSGVRPRAPGTATARGGPLAGKLLVLTGALPNLTRAQATTRITAAGGTVAASVSEKADYIVTGEGSGAKLAAARALGVVVIDETELLRLLTSE